MLALTPARRDAGPSLVRGSPPAHLSGGLEFEMNLRVAVNRGGARARGVRPSRGMPPMYLRETRAADLSTLPEALRAALLDWASRHQLTLDAARIWHTRSENPPGEGFIARLLGRRANPVDPNAFHDAALLLHPTQLLVANLSEKGGAMVMGVALVSTSVTRGSALAGKIGAAAPSDDGISISGFPGAEGGPGTWFFGMGGAAADACFDAVASAVRAAKAGVAVAANRRRPRGAPAVTHPRAARTFPPRT